MLRCRAHFAYAAALSTSAAAPSRIGLLEDLVPDPRRDPASRLEQQVERSRVDLAVTAAAWPRHCGVSQVRTPRSSLKPKSTGVVRASQSMNVGEKQLVDPLLRLPRRHLDDEAAVELGAFEALRLPLARVAAPVVEAAGQLVGPAAEHRHPADALGDPADQDRVLPLDVDAEVEPKTAWWRSRTMAPPGDRPAQRPDAVLDRARLLRCRHVAGPRLFLPQLEAARRAVVAQCRLAPPQPCERLALVPEHRASVPLRRPVADREDGAFAVATPLSARRTGGTRKRPTSGTSTKPSIDA